MKYSSKGNPKETVVVKKGPFDRKSDRGPYFDGVHGGTFNAFEAINGEVDGRGCASSGS